MRGVFERLLGRVTVQHSVPGRLKLHIPLLAHIPHDAPVADYAKVAAEAVDGVSRAEISLVTHTMVLSYDPNTRTEAELLGLVQDIAAIAAQNAERFASLSNARQNAIAVRLREHFQSTQLEPGKEIELPHDLWTI